MRPTRARWVYAWKTLKDAKGTDILHVPVGWVFMRNATRRFSTSSALVRE